VARIIASFLLRGLGLELKTVGNLVQKEVPCMGRNCGMILIYLSSHRVPACLPREVGGCSHFRFPNVILYRGLTRCVSRPNITACRG
jgi:hypothetical protein